MRKGGYLFAEMQKKLLLKEYETLYQIQMREIWKHYVVNSRAAI